MPIIRQKMIYRDDLRANRNVLYIFGDNEARVGLGGQAAEMRDEPNAIGVCTKHDPGRHPYSYYSDHHYDENMVQIDKDLEIVWLHLMKGGVVVFPYAGIGTDRAEMPIRAPITYEKLSQRIKDMFDQFDVKSV